MKTTAIVIFSLSLITVTILATGAQAQVTAESVDLAPWGGALSNNGGTVTAISDNLFLIATLGPDGVNETADDVVVLINAIGQGNITTTPMATPYLSSSGYHNAIRLSSTQAVIQGTGPDQGFGGADDQLYVLDGLGSTNTVSVFSLPHQINGFSGRPVPLGSGRLVFSTAGPDGSGETADDELVLVEGLGGAVTQTPIPAPYIYDAGSAQPVPVSSTSLAVRSLGPAGTDRGFYYISDVLGSPTVSFVPVKNPYELSPGLPVPLTSTSLLLASAGDDDSEESADDEVALVEGLGGAPTVTYLPVPYILDYGGGWIQVFSQSLATIGTAGADGSEETADDSTYVLTNIGGSNTLTEVVVGGTEEDIQSRCQILTPTSCVMTTGGTNFSYDDLDDEVVIISGLGGSNTLTRIPVPGMDDRVGSRTTAINANTVMVANGGPDGGFAAGDDDTMTVISGLETGTPAVETVAAVGSWNSGSTRAHVAAAASGATTAAFTSAGLDGSLETADDVVRVVFNLPTGVVQPTEAIPVNHPAALAVLILLIAGLGVALIRLRA